MKDVLVKSYRMHEVHSYIWSDDAKNTELGIKTDLGVRIINAQTPDHQYIRVSMIPTLLSFAKENRTYSDDYSIFEIGHTVDGYKENGYCNEKKKLGVVLYSKTRSEEELFMNACDVVRELVSDILHGEVTFGTSENMPEYCHPKNTFDVFVSGNKIGYVSVPHPVVLNNIDKKCRVAFLEIVTEDFANAPFGRINYSEPSKFPQIDIDVTFNANVEEVSLDEVRKAATAVSELVSAVNVKDISTADDGSAALTLRFTFVSRERTLSKQELSPIQDGVVNALVSLGLTKKY
jgi:phenylalanyl-tRNA synthetase beta chain